MTAIEWLEKRFYFTKGQLIDIDFKQAKAMEKEQIIESFLKGHEFVPEWKINIVPHYDAEEYYNETFKSE